MKTVIISILFVLSAPVSTLAHADCYGAYAQGSWQNVCGEVPTPPSQYSVPTPDIALNQNDKLYLCSLLQLSESQCAQVHFSTGAGGVLGKKGVVQSGFDVRMEYNSKKCSGVVWKTLQLDNTWVLSSPTSIFGFPSTCNIP